MGGDYVLSIFGRQTEGITLNDTADRQEIISPPLDQINRSISRIVLLEVTSPGLETLLKTKEAFSEEFAMACQYQLV